MKRIFYIALAFLLGFSFAIGAEEYHSIAGASRAELIVETEITVESYLKSPATADFCSFSEYVVKVDPEAKLATVKGYVDSQNGFGAMLRTQFFIEFDISNLKNLRVIYIELGDQSSGTFKAGNFNVID